MGDFVEAQTIACKFTKGRQRKDFGSQCNENNESDPVSTTTVHSDIHYIMQLAKTANFNENRCDTLVSVFHDGSAIETLQHRNSIEINTAEYSHENRCFDKHLRSNDTTCLKDDDENFEASGENQMRDSEHSERRNEENETQSNIADDAQNSNVVHEQPPARHRNDTSRKDVPTDVESFEAVEETPPYLDQDAIALNLDQRLDVAECKRPFSKANIPNVPTPEKHHDIEHPTQSDILDEEAVLAETDKLFSQVTDKLSVTVKDIIQSLCANFNVRKMTKSFKALVRQRLIQLIEEEQKMANQDEESQDSCAHSESGGYESEVTVNEEKDEDYELNENKRSARRRRKRDTKAGKLHNKGRGTEKAPKINAKTKKSAMRIQQEQLRKRRLEELRIRNEELQAVASKKDQERAERIAAKFDTNREDLRLQRLENRLDLLQKLDQKRISCVSGELITIPNEKTKNDEKEQLMEINNLPGTKTKLETDNGPDIESIEENSDSEDSDDDLQIVGGNDSEKKLFSLQADQSKKLQNSAMLLLDLADQAKLKLPTILKLSSPGRNLNARAQLRLKLLSKQRRLGNEWLARELGYKSQEDHLRDCQKAEERKREMIRKREEERVKANERRLLRERMLKVEATGDDEHNDLDDESYNALEGNSDLVMDDSAEDDEEMQLAKALEKESASLSHQESEIENEERDEDEEETTSFGDSESYIVNEERDKGDEQIKEPENVGNDENILINEDTESFEDNNDTIVCIDGNEDNISVRKIESNVTSYVSSKSDTSESPSVEEGSDSPETEELLNNSNLEGSPDDLSVGKKSRDEEEESTMKPAGPRNSAWRAMLEKEAQNRKKKKKSGLIEEEADEEEEEHVVGLEDFGFTVAKKKVDEDDEEENADYVDEDDLKHVVDDISDDEGDEEAGEMARKEMEQKEEKEQHKAMLRRMRDGYDGRRGGIAVGTGARGIHRFDQLVAADNKDDAKRLGLLNDDELDSDNEEKDENADEEEEDEAALIDKMLKDRFLHRSSGDVDEESFSENEETETTTNEAAIAALVDEEELQQERLAKRFAKRARMQRILEAHEHEEEFSQLRLMDEDTTLKLELQNMKNGLSRKRSVSSSQSESQTSIAQSSESNSNKMARKTNQTLPFSGLCNTGNSSLALALQHNRRSTKLRTSFVRSQSSQSGTMSSDVVCSSFSKSIAFNHIVFHSIGESQSQFSKCSNFGMEGSSNRSDSFTAKKKSCLSSLFEQSVVNGFHKRKRT